ncbi:MAG: hypothetical protein J2P44_05005 [Candidatus Dormibacteraeota bacterium]|nr:hypothetical protein [Candidatus Dormibacteraeota bacterium]
MSIRGQVLQVGAGRRVRGHPECRQHEGDRVGLGVIEQRWAGGTLGGGQSLRAPDQREQHTEPVGGVQRHLLIRVPQPADQMGDRRRAGPGPEGEEMGEPPPLGGRGRELHRLHQIRAGCPALQG